MRTAITEQASPQSMEWSIIWEEETFIVDIGDAAFQRARKSGYRVISGGSFHGQKGGAQALAGEKSSSRMHLVAASLSALFYNKERVGGGL